MTQYPKEYAEALSRLNAPERSPLPYAPIPYGPVPNPRNYFNWNKIMLERSQSNLPKYSILQRFDLGDQNDLHKETDNKEYTYTLDPSFTYAQCDRKSIAVRQVNIYSAIPPGQTVKAIEHFAGGFRLKITDSYTMFGDDYDIEIPLTNINFDISNDLRVSLNLMAKNLGSMIYLTMISALSSGDYEENPMTVAINPNYEAFYEESDNTLTMRFYANKTDDSDFMFLNVDDYDADNSDQGPLWVMFRSNVYDYWNQKGVITGCELSARLLPDPDDEKQREEDIKNNPDADYDPLPTVMLEIKLLLPDDIIDYRSATLCSDINPWTQYNILAPVDFNSDTLTKVFPWNGNTEIKFWFIDDSKDKKRWRYVRGYVDLELIIDNTNSFAIDTR